MLLHELKFEPRDSSGYWVECYIPHPAGDTVFVERTTERNGSYTTGHYWIARLRGQWARGAIWPGFAVMDRWEDIDALTAQAVLHHLFPEKSDVAERG